METLTPIQPATEPFPQDRNDDSDTARLNTQPSYDASEIEAEQEQILLQSSPSSSKSTSSKLKKQFIPRPITQVDHRARWIPGNRYLPLLILQYLWHPFALLISEYKSFMRGKDFNHSIDSDHHLHHPHQHHVHHHEAHSNSIQHRPSSSEKMADLFVE